MRIICPNCGAQYEVDPRVIPDVGRDVQCSNCGHTWFQRPQSAVAASVRRVVEDPPVSPGPEADLPPEDRDDDVVMPGAGAVPSPAPGAARVSDMFPTITGDDGRDDAAADGPQDADWPPVVAATDAPPPRASDLLPDIDDGTTDDAPTRAGAVAAPDVLPGDDRPALDDATRALLREEAEREARARAAERRPAVEVQGDFGLAPPAASAPVASAAAAVTHLPPPRSAQRMADLGGDAAAVSPVATALAAAASRRDSLPDVDSISSSLRGGMPGTDTPADPSDAVEAGPDRRFRSGFLLVLLLVIAASVVYLYAPALADAVPGLRAPLAGYVAWVNDLRATITGALAGLAALLTGAAT
jgi:predicted Zn finger-like uncharacterized protein